MSGKKGQKHYTSAIKIQVQEEWESGASVKGLSKKHGISRYAIQSWCGLRPEANFLQGIPGKRGRPRKNLNTTQQELEQKNKRLQMENELLRDFLHTAGRK